MRGCVTELLQDIEWTAGHCCCTGQGNPAGKVFSVEGAENSF